MLTEKKIQELIDQRNQVSHESLKAAIQETIDEAQERQKNGLKVAIVQIRAHTTVAVDALRAARKQEAEAKARLEVVASAEEAFAKTADVEAYAAAMWPKDSSQAQNFLRQFQGSLLVA